MKKKINGELRTIGIIRCEEPYKLYYQRHPGYVSRFDFYFCFEDDLPLLGDTKKEVEEGDIINMLTLIDLDFPPFKDEDYGSKPYYTDLDPHMGNNYLVTFLIELDPL